MVGARWEQVLLNEVGGHRRAGGQRCRIAALLDQQKVDYVLMSTTTLEQSLQKGFSDRYQVVFSGSDLRVPIAMATQLQDPILNAKGDSSDVGGGEFRRGVSPAGFECIV